MTREDSIRKEILFQCYAVRPLALGAARMERDARKSGYDFLRIEITREAQFLTDEKLLVEVSLPGSTEKLYRITGEGVRQYEQHYAA